MTESRKVPTANAMLDPRIIDPNQELVDYSTFDETEIAQITRVLVGIREWREAEQALSFRSRDDMKLNENDMRALRFLVASKNQGSIVTAGAVADHLKISTASTTKLLDRLSNAGHIKRSPHPKDRRATMITITDRTHQRVRETVGRNHARRFTVAAHMKPEDRDIVIKFLHDLSTSTTSDVTLVDP